MAWIRRLPFRPWRDPQAAVKIAAGILGILVWGVIATSFANSGPDGPSAAEGARLFKINCSSSYCHGDKGMGGGAPQLRGRGLDRAFLVKTISNGVPGTPMLSFKDSLSEQQIGSLAVYLESASEPADNPVDSGAQRAGEQAAAEKKDEPASQSARAGNSAPGADSLVGNPSAGKESFFDMTRPESCHSCHAVNGSGGAVGPDLTDLKERPARDIFLAIVNPNRPPAGKYSTVKITLTDGATLIGVIKEEDGESIRVDDITELPAVRRTIQKSNVARKEPVTESSMPGNYASVYTLKQVLDITAFLKVGEGSKTKITLRDLF